ncbi:MAG: hypothetical protein QGG90_06190, partial [Nitrospinota bacterium]|nr:hypothetical protein [Nitrospinota bacterium]
MAVNSRAHGPPLLFSPAGVSAAVLPFGSALAAPTARFGVVLRKYDAETVDDVAAKGVLTGLVNDADHV